MAKQSLQKPTKKQMDEAQIIQRRDEAVRRALNTPPKPHKEMKKGKKRAGGDPTSSEKRT